MFLNNIESNIAEKYFKLGRRVSSSYISIGAGLFFSESDLKNHYEVNTRFNQVLVPRFLVCISYELYSPIYSSIFQPYNISQL